MRRSIGVTLSAVASILGSALLLVLVLILTVTMLLRPDTPGMNSLVRISLFVGGSALFALSAWGILTAVGLLRLFGWARWSMLAFSAFLTFVGATAAIGVLLGGAVPAPGVSPQLMRGVLVATGAVYTLLALIGAFWLYYFNTRGVKAQFDGSAQPPGGRPFSLTLIAVLMVVGGAMCGVFALLPLPAALCGWLISGWGARIFYAVLAAIEVWLAWGLLRLRPLSRVLSIAFFVFGAANSLLLALWPGAAARVVASVAVFSPELRYGAVSQVPSLIGGILAVPFSAVLIWILIKARPAFYPAPAAELPTPETPTQA